MEEKQLVPKRRFKEFEGEWKKKNFDEEIELYSGLTYSPNDVQKNGTFVLRSSNVQNGEIVSADDVYVDSEVVNSSNVREGDIIVVVRNGSRSLIGKHAKIKKSMDKTVIGAFMTGVRSNQPNFINALLDTQNFKREIDKNLGATINQITNGMFKSMSFIIPNVKEQQKIGEFFKVLDERIANQKRKIAKVKALKAAYLTEMFPQEGETVPKRRFKGYTEPWEQKKLCELGTTISGIGFPNVEQGGKEGVPFYKISDMNLLGNEIEMFKASNFVSQKQVKQKKWEPIKSIPAVIFAKVGAAIMMNRKRLINHTFLIDNNTMAYIFNDDWDTYFGKTLFDTLDLPKYAQVGALPSYNGTDIGGIDVIIPNKKEQQKIGEFFKNLDNQIETEEKKLDKLQKMKEAYLEEMFV